MKLDANILTKNIIKAYKQCSKVDLNEGNFYQLAQAYCKELALKHEVSVEKVAGIIAVLSPATNWEQNKIDADNFLYGNGKKLTTYGQFITKAHNILLCDSQEEIFAIVYGKQGYKTSCFFMNILGYDNIVTIDRHAYKIATNSKDAGGVRMTANQYHIVQAAYLMAASKLHVSPLFLQATVWHMFKRVNERGNFRTEIEDVF